MAPGYFRAAIRMYDWTGPRFDPTGWVRVPLRGEPEIVLISPILIRCVLKKGLPMRCWVPLLFSLTASVALGCASIRHTGGPDRVSGTWKTDAPAPYIIEHSEHKPHGTSVPHDHIELLERAASVEWQLEERPDGLITGTTHWVSYGPNGEELFRGTEPLLGARDFGRLIIEEAADDKTHTPQMVFHCTFEGSDRIRVIGYVVGSKDLMAMRFVLLRE